jgi:hypothetical protein
MKTFLAREVATDTVGGWDYVPVPAYLVQAGNFIFAQTPDGAFYRIPVQDGPVRAQRIEESAWRTGILEEMGTVDDKKLQALTTPEDAERALGLQRDRDLAGSSFEDVFQNRSFSGLPRPPIAPRASMADQTLQPTYATTAEEAAALKSQRRAPGKYGWARKLSRIPVLQDILRPWIRTQLESPPGVMRDRTSQPPEAMRLLASNQVTADAAESALFELAKALDSSQGRRQSVYGLSVELSSIKNQLAQIDAKANDLIVKQNPAFEVSPDVLRQRAALDSQRAALEERQLAVMDEMHAGNSGDIDISPETVATLIDYRASNPDEFGDLIYGLRSKIEERNAYDLLSQASGARRRGDQDWANALRSRSEANMRGAQVDKDIVAFLDNDEAVATALRRVLEQDPRNATYPTLRAIDLLESRYADAMGPQGLYDVPAGAGANPTDPSFLRKFREVAAENFARVEPDLRSRNLPPASPYLMSFVNALRGQMGQRGPKNVGFFGELENRSGASRSITRTKMRELESRVMDLEALDPQSPEYAALSESIDAMVSSMMDDYGGRISQGEAAALSQSRFAQQDPIRRREGVAPESEGGSLDEIRREAIDDDGEDGATATGPSPESTGFAAGFASMLGNEQQRAFLFGALNDPMSEEAKGLAQFSQRPDQLRQMLYRTYLRSGLGQAGVGDAGATQFLSTGGIQLGDVERYFDKLAALNEEERQLRSGTFFSRQLESDLMDRPRGGRPRSKRDQELYRNTQARLDEIARERAAWIDEGKAIPGLQENYSAFQAMLDEAIAPPAGTRPAPLRGRGAARDSRTWGEYVRGLVRDANEALFPQPAPLARADSPEARASVIATLDNSARDTVRDGLALSPTQLELQMGRRKLFTEDEASALRAAASGAEGAFVPEGIEGKVLENIRWAEGRKAQLGDTKPLSGTPAPDDLEQRPGSGSAIQDYNEFIREMNSILEFVRQAPRQRSPLGPDPTGATVSPKASSAAAPELPSAGPLFELLDDPRSLSQGAGRQWEDIQDLGTSLGRKLPKEFVVYARPGSQAESAMEYLSGRRRVAEGDLVASAERRTPPADAEEEVRRILKAIEPHTDIPVSTGYDDPALPTLLESAAQSSDQERAEALMAAARQINDIRAAQREAVEPAVDVSDTSLRGIDTFSLGDVSRLGDQLVLQAYLGGGANVVRPQTAARPGKRIFVPLSMEPVADVMGRTSAYQFDPESGRFRRAGTARADDIQLRTDTEEAARVIGQSGELPETPAPPTAPRPPAQASAEDGGRTIRRLLALGALGAGGMAAVAKMNEQRDTNTVADEEIVEPVPPPPVRMRRDNPIIPAAGAPKIRQLLPQR